MKCKDVPTTPELKFYGPNASVDFPIFQQNVK